MRSERTDKSLLLERGVHNRLDGVHAVLGLVEDLGLLGLEDGVLDLHLGDTELLGDVLADGGVGAWKAGRQCRKIAEGSAMAMSSVVTR